MLAKMHQKAFGGRALPGPAGGAYSAPPDPLAATKGILLLRGGEGGKGQGRARYRKGKIGGGEGR